MKVATCPLCRARKGKRACPAKGETICSVCCGSKRRVTIDCPDDCAYLTGAHAPAWEGRETERIRDLRRFGPHLEPLDEPQLQLAFYALTRLHAMRAQHQDLDDRRLLSALDAFARTLDTRVKGVLYEHAPDDLRAGPVLRDLEEWFSADDEAGRPVAPPDRDLLAVMHAITGALRDTLRQPDSPTMFLDTVTRIASRIDAEEPRPSQRPLIIEP